MLISFNTNLEYKSIKLPFKTGRFEIQLYLNYVRDLIQITF